MHGLTPLPAATHSHNSFPHLPLRDVRHIERNGLYEELPDATAMHTYADSEVAHLKQRLVRSEMSRAQISAKLVADQRMQMVNTQVRTGHLPAWPPMHAALCAGRAHYTALQARLAVQSPPTSLHAALPVPAARLEDTCMRVSCECLHMSKQPASASWLNLYPSTSHPPLLV